MWFFLASKAVSLPTFTTNCCKLTTCRFYGLVTTSCRTPPCLFVLLNKRFSKELFVFGELFDTKSSLEIWLRYNGSASVIRTSCHHWFRTLCKLLLTMASEAIFTEPMATVFHFHLCTFCDIIIAAGTHSIFCCSWLRRFEIESAKNVIWLFLQLLCNLSRVPTILDQ